MTRRTGKTASNGAQPEPAVFVSTAKLGRRVRQKMRAAGLSLETAAKQAGIGAATLRRIVSGEHPPNTRTLTRLAEWLDVPLEKLVERKKDVFVGSTQDDIVLNKDLVRRLRSAGVEVFPVNNRALASDVILGFDQDYLREASKVLLLLTNRSINSHGLSSQLGLAYGLGKLVTLVLVDLEAAALAPIYKGISSIKYADLLVDPSRLSTTPASSKNATHASRR